MVKDISGGRIFDIGFTAKNTVFGFLLSIALLFIASWIATVAALPEAIVSLAVGAVTNISVGVCGFRAARHTKAHGLLSGAVAGLIYVILLYFTGSLAFGELSFSNASLLTIIICILSGAIGGILGINIRQKKRR